MLPASSRACRRQPIGTLSTTPLAFPFSLVAISARTARRFGCTCTAWARGQLVLPLVCGLAAVLTAAVPLRAQGGPTGAAAPSTALPPRSSPSPNPLNQAAGGLVTIESDRQQADNVTGIVTAIGNVRITYPDRGMVATARQAQYYTREGRLVLSGDVDVVDRDGQRLRAEQLVYQLNGQRLLAIPLRGQQVQTRLRLQTQPGAPAPRPLLP